MELSQEDFEKLKRLPIFKGTVITGSMEPVVKVGDVVTVEVGAVNLRRFDIIIFYRQGKLICHYLWLQNKVFSALLQTRALNGGGKDFPITPENYLGKVISHRIPLWRKILILLK